MMHRFTAALFVTFLSVASAQAQAQYDSDSMSPPADAADAAHLQVRISELEEQMRNMQGSLERVTFENKQLKEQLDKSASDTQYRLTALENKQAAAAPVATPPAEDTSQLKPVVPPSDMADATDPNSVAPKQQGVDATPKFSNPRDLYTYAYGLLSHAKYAQAGDAFYAFTQQYPKDALIGNAFYWLGETYYVRRDYIHAADNFRQGYQSMPTGSKAADNLLKLSMTLNALNKDKEACGVLRQVVIKFGADSAPTKAKAEQEINRIGCS